MPVQNALSIVFSALLVQVIFAAPAAVAVPIFAIEWQDSEWTVNPTSAESGGGIATTGATQTNPAPNTLPTLRTKAVSPGVTPDASSSNAEIKVSRAFRVTRNEPIFLPMSLNGEVNGYVRRRVSGHAQLTAIAQVTKTDTTPNRTSRECDVNALMCDRAHRNPGSSSSSKRLATKTLTGEAELAVGASYTIHGNLYGRGDPDSLILKNNTATGVMDLRDPVKFTDALDKQYYRRAWSNEWTATGLELHSPNNTETAEAALDQFTGLVASAVPGGPIAQQAASIVIDNVLDALLFSDTLEIGAFEDGVSMVMAKGINTGNAVVRVVSERDFRIVANESAPAELAFDGLLSGELFSTENTGAALELAQISVAGTGLGWSRSFDASNGETQIINEAIEATGWAQTDQIYVLEAIMKTSSFANANATTQEEAYADFFNSLDGVLSVNAAFFPIPEPRGIWLLAFGLMLLTASGRIRLTALPQDL